MLLGGPISDPARVPAGARRRHKIEALRERFAKRFPSVDYELVWHVGAVNAQAIREPDRNRVLIYGGLLSSQVMKIEGIALAFAHETGHLLGGKPALWFNPSLSCECRADYWAGDVAIPAVFGRRQGADVLRRGIDQFDSLLRRLSQRGMAGLSPTELTAFKRRHLLAGFNGRRKPPCLCAPL